MANWQQELQQEIIGIEDKDKNTGIIGIRIDTLDDFFGGEGRIIEINRSIIIGPPERVSEKLTDGYNYLSGDFVCNIAFLRLKDVMQSQPDDPEIELNGVAKTLEEVRPFTASNHWGIDIGDDTLTVGGDTWTIAAVKADKWLDNEPARLELTLRK